MYLAASSRSGRAAASSSASFLRLSRAGDCCGGGACGTRGYKILANGHEARAKMLTGVEKLTDAVKATMGPSGRNVIIEQSWGSSKITKDGVTVAKAVELQDKFENIGAKVLQEVATKSNNDAGDGTTCSTVLAKSIAADIIRNSTAGRNPIQIRKGIMEAQAICEAQLNKMSRPVDSQEFLKNVATISANGDSDLGELIAQAFTMSKKNGAISVKDGKTMKDSVEHVQGMKYDKGFISPYFTTNKKGDKAELKDAVVLLCESKITTVKQVLPALECAHKMSKPLLIIAEDVENEALSMLILNKLRASVACCAVKAPGFGDNRKAMLEDIATATGGKVLGDSSGINKIEEVKESDLGVVNDATISKDDFLLIGGRGSTSEIEARVQHIKEMIAESDSDYDKEKMQERVAKLSDGAAVIYVGGSSEMEVGEKKDRINDAMSATKAAIEMGIVPGGGVGLLRCYEHLNNIPEGLNQDQALGYKIVQRSLSLPIRTIIENTGIDSDEIVQNVMDAGSTNQNMGYNVVTSRVEDMVEAGVIDPTKVVISSLRSALHVASLLGTAEYVICDAPKSEEKNSAAGANANHMMDY